MEIFSPPTTPKKGFSPCSFGNPYTGDKSHSPLASGGSSLNTSPIRNSSNTGGFTTQNKVSASANNISDRFIPNRAGMDMDYCSHFLEHNDENIASNLSALSPGQVILNRDLQTVSKQTPGKKILNCFESSRRVREEASSSPIKMPLTGLAPPNELATLPYSSPKRSSSRSVPNDSSRVLDAPDLMDDYYLNLLDWGPNNVIGIGLHQTVFLWNGANCHIEQLLDLSEADYVTSVQWSKHDNTIAVGTYNNNVEIWDTVTLQKIRDLPGHTSRVSSLSWNPTSATSLSTAGRDSSILQHDIRISSGHGGVTSSYQAHQQEICGLSWSPDGSSLASGGNDNLLCLWDISMSGNSSRGLHNSGTHEPKFKINQHHAAVKALSWCPWHRNVLASGGGTADRTIRTWNTALGTNLKCVDTNSQVCALQWSDSSKELVSSHGFSDNQLILWNYPTMTKIKEFRGHSSRVLHMAKSPDGTTVCSASADETIRFWDLFGNKNSHFGGSGGSYGSDATRTTVPSPTKRKATSKHSGISSFCSSQLSSSKLSIR